MWYILATSTSTQVESHRQATTDIPGQHVHQDIAHSEIPSCQKPGHSDLSLTSLLTGMAVVYFIFFLLFGKNSPYLNNQV